MKLEIPFHKQETWYYCGPTVMQMVFSYFGIQIKQKNIAQLLDTNASSQGTLCGQIESVAYNTNLRCHAKKNASYESIQEYVCQDMPVIVNYFDTNTQRGHYAVVVSCSDENITLNDPTYGKDYVMSKEHFVRYWHCSCGCSKQWIAAFTKGTKVTGLISKLDNQ